MDISNPSHRCFICGNKIIGETPSIDHLIPWSFLFSDDIWNLNYTHQSCNSQKSNAIPNEVEIHQMERKNNRFHDLLNANSEMRSKKITKELEVAIEKDYLRKFWIGCKT